MMDSLARRRGVHLSNSEAFDMFIRSPPRDIDKSLASSLLILAPLPLLDLEPLPGPSPNDGMPAREPGLEPGPVPVPVPGVRTVSLAATLVALPLIPPPTPSGSHPNSHSRDSIPALFPPSSSPLPSPFFRVPLCQHRHTQVEEGRGLRQG